MKTIHKYGLELSGDPVALALKEGSRVVRCEYIVAEKRVCLWVEVPLKVDIPETTSTFCVVRSGEPIADSYQYVDTAVDPFGPEAYHVFQLTQEQPGDSADASRSWIHAA
ncbi:hypothetical protein C8D92_104259 [Tamilnaduibacter salinus]|uniref:DUF7352 domain-containing protein n=1 Tax=Tamilnaduibacter salinus TaxID=1484056 RepID=A0A2A2I8A6_9GAMM|nr:hypothetical protein [Tamilnaduibacter salinus]PAV27524.1 hypothetical protein CF392_00205 [Tamilnaduibacter salinus]PVY77025.1 hypothetical protein C8D92_104259 [Tamilnaduibacter salinus]